jgi:L-gulonolactone oxidase
MTNVPSISKQTLGGVISTATHGSGINFGVLSTHVMALELLLADGSRVFCSRHERPDLFSASLCGLGSTGLIITVQLQVEPAFRLIETQETLDFDFSVKNLDELVSSAQHVRFWWFPVSSSIRACFANRTRAVWNTSLFGAIFCLTWPFV